MKSYDVGLINVAFAKEKEVQLTKDNLDQSRPTTNEDQIGSDGTNLNQSGQGQGTSTDVSHSTSCMKISKTVALTFSLVSLGLFLEIVGSSIDYLEQLINGSTEDVSLVLVARSVGYFVSSLFGGYLCDRFSRFIDLFISVSFLLAAIGTAAAPWCTNKVLLGFMFFLQGAAQGTICTGGNSIAIKVWGENTGAPLVAQHLAFGVGALIAPQIVKAFLKENDLVPVSTPLYSTSSPIVLSTLEGSTDDYSDVKYAYVIVGIIALCFAVAFCVFYFIDEDSRKDIGSNLDYREILNPGSCANGDSMFSVIFFILFFLMYIQIVGGERLFSKYFYKFTTDGNAKFTKSQAADIMTLFWLCFTIGRAVNLVAAHFLSPVIIMVVLAVGNVVNGILFAVLGNDNSTSLWVLSGTYGFFLSPLFPTGLVWANLYLQITAVGVSLGYVGSAVGDTIYQYLGGFLFDDVGPDSLMYLICGYSVGLAVCYIIIQVIASRHGQRNSSNSNAVSTNGENDPVVIMTVSKMHLDNDML